MNKRTLSVVGLLSLSACMKNVEPPKEEAKQEAPPPAPAPKTYTALTRVDFNARAAERFEPLFWRADANQNNAIDPDELVTLIGPWSATRSDFVSDGKFTAKFDALYDAMAAGALKPTDARGQALQLELSQGKPTLVETDFATFSEADKKAFPHFVRAAALIEKIYGRTHAIDAIAAKIPADDVLSRAVFHRNQGAFCVAPKTEKDENCTVLAEKPSHAVGLYPAAIQSDAKFCEKLEKEKNKKDLMGHFSAVVEDGKGFKAVPYTEIYKDDMEAVAIELEAAAAVFGDDEAAFKKYLTEAAKSFRSNDWEPANAAWVAMGPLNSKWYLRVAPDEVYHEPCAWKAGFALQLARINPASLEWQKKLEPVKGDMEKTLAGFAGAPYKARDVKFKLPDFIDVTLNAADQRNPHGATIGQSLPNWGKVAESGGRTVVMTNLYTDFDSQQNLKAQTASLFCKATFDSFTTEPKAALLSVVLHEASHNLGPAHDYAVKGKKDDDVFGGPLASTLEELKAQTSALFFTWWLVEKGLLTEEEAKHSSLRDVAWAFGHISRGVYDAEKHPRPYSQLASIQLGHAFKSGVLHWIPDEKAANGTDTGCFEVDLAKWKPAVTELEKRVLHIKGAGDKKDAEALKATFVDADDEWAKLRGTITERWLRAPKATFVYAVKE